MMRMALNTFVLCMWNRWRTGRTLRTHSTELVSRKNYIICLADCDFE